MKIYLVQHAKAKSEDEDPNRPLSGDGIKELKAVSLFLKKSKIKVNAVYHSEKLRAKESAEILNKSVDSQNGIKELAGLKPNDDPAPIFDLINGQEKDLMLVGHMPFMGKLAGLLLNNDKNTAPVLFKQGAVVSFEKNIESGNYQITFMITPEEV